MAVILPAIVAGNIVDFWTLMTISNKYYITGHDGRKYSYSLDSDDCIKYVLYYRP